MVAWRLSTKTFRRCGGIGWFVGRTIGNGVAALDHARFSVNKDGERRLAWLDLKS
jgi:hypothetical protein